MIRWSFLFVFVCFIMLFTPHIIHANSLLNLSVDKELYEFSDDIYDFIDRILVKGNAENFPKNMRPYSRGELAKILFDLSERLDNGEIKLSKIEKRQLETLKYFFSDDLEKDSKAIPDKVRKHLIEVNHDESSLMADWGMSFGTISRNGEKFPSEGTDYITSLRPIFSGQIKDSFALLSDIKFDYHKGDIFYDLFSEKHNISYENSEHVFSTDGYSIFKLPWFKLLLGKDKIKWGPGYHGQLMLSSNPESANMMKLDLEFKNIRFQSFTSKLLSELGKKYMSAHRMEFLLFDRLDLGLSETLIFGDEFAIEYLNPFQLFAISEGITESYSGKANLLESVDISCRIVDGLQIYGELAVDEARLLVKPLNHWDTIFGILGGFYIADPFSINDTDFRVEYAFTNQYFYTYHQPLPNYSHLDSSIGHWMGTDADDLWCEIKHRLTDRFQTALSYELERHGEGDMDTPHPVGKGFDDGRWTFLSGVNEYKHSFGINVSYRKIGSYLLAMGYTHSLIENIDNKKGENGTGNQLTFEISYWY